MRTLAGNGFAALLDGALHDWMPLDVYGESASWSIRTRTRRDGAGWLLAAAPEDEPRWLNDPRLRILLDHHSRSAPLLPELGPVIVLERDGAVRRLLASQIERIGALCYLADDLPAAVRLLEAEPRAATILIDIETAGADFAGWVQGIRGARASARVIATGGSGTADEWLDLGVSCVLDKPWRIDELVDALSGR